MDLQLDAHPLLLRCDADKIKSVIVNLMLNATDAVDAGSGQIAVQTRSSALGSQISDLRSKDEAPRQVVLLSVADNGRGISEEDLPRIFEPFYSTKASGSGLGLAISSNLVNAHGGRIEVASRAGGGTTFTITLPADGFEAAPPDGLMLSENEMPGREQTSETAVS